MSERAKDQQIDTRGQILDAALGRFSVYGLRKTTMAEIAEDAQMSAANLYRYFENKHEIAAACAWRCMCDGLDAIRPIVREPSLNAAERLRKLVLEGLRYVYSAAEGNCKINELVENVVVRKPELALRKNEAMESLIAEILAQGNQSGEFAVDDVVATARSVHHSLLFFEVPVFMSLYSLGQFERYANDTVDLLLKGLEKR